MLVFDSRDATRDGFGVFLSDIAAVNLFHLSRIKITFFKHIIDHALQAHFTAVFHRKDVIYSIGLQLLNLISNNNATTASIYIDMPGSALFQQIYHILEILHMPALI